MDLCAPDPHSCLIADSCHGEGELNPLNDCEGCNPSADRTRWTPRFDFSPCNMVTSPDRSYDICSAGVCISPGCGDVSCNPPGPHFRLPDTGQRDCFDAIAVPCSSAAGGSPCDPSGLPDLCGQDAQYGWDTVHPPADRFVRDLSVTEQPTVFDVVTGLRWQGCAAGLAGPSCSEGWRWVQAWEDAVEYCDTLSWGGWDDWHLPDVFEFHSLVDYGAPDTAIDPIGFPGSPPDSFWSLSFVEPAVVADAAWAHMLWHRWLISEVRVSEALAVRCVRGGTPVGVRQRYDRTEPVPEQPIVSDNVTGLVWQGCTAGTEGSACGRGDPMRTTWQNALGECEALLWAGWDDWRLPDAKELFSIVDTRRASPAVPMVYFPRVARDQTWTSTTQADQPDVARVVTLAPDGAAVTLPKASDFGAVLCVRGGPAP